MNIKTNKKLSFTAKFTAILVLLVCSQYILTGVYVGKEIIGGITKRKVLSSVSAATDNNNLEDPNAGEYLRLSNTKTENSIPYRSESHAGWGSLKVNQDSNGNKLSVKIEGAYYPFDYGIWAHASSELYYDVSEYSEKYHYLTLYMGINQTSNSGNGVKVMIYTSNKDQFYTTGSQNWDLKNTESYENVIMPGQNAVFEKIDIRGAKYLRISGYDNKGNGNDHLVYINPMLITDDYEENQGSSFLSVEECDKKIKEYANKNLSDPKYEQLLLQRKFVSSVGNYALKRFIEEDPSNEETINWLMNDVENLRYYILGGAPSGSYYNSLKELTKLLKAYKSDFNDQTQISDAGKTLLAKKNLNWPTAKGNLYKRMAITLSLTHSARVGLWMQNSQYNQSDSVNRYKIYKDLYNNGQFKATDTVDMTSWFETFKIEEMRWVLGVNLDDEEIVWLNEYTQTRIDAQPGSVWGLLTPHPYMAYVWPNYANPVYYNEENKEYFNELFKTVKKNADGTTTEKGLFEYIPYRNGTPYTYKLWMNFRNKFGTGAVCGGISKSGHCIRGVNSIPSAVIGQPGHAALLYFNQNAEGIATWGIDNDVSGWVNSEKGERMPLGWGNDRTYKGQWNVPYVLMAQDALNDYNNLVKAEELLMTVDVYKGDNAKQEAIYREAIKTQSINLDAWAGLAKLYVADETKTEEQIYKLAEEMMNATKCYPFTMYDLSKYISRRLTSVEYKFKFTLLQTRILEEGKSYKGTATVSPATTNRLAAHLLGQIDNSLAKFSFDGTDAGKIVLSSRFDGNGVRWDYSLDGKKTWTEVSFDGSEEHKHQLTEKELASITSENDIYVHIVGVNYNEENLYKIDILESTGLPATLYANDLENRIIAVNLTTEWRYKETDRWTKYSEGSPDLTGNKTVQIRQGATGTRLAGEEIKTYTFTQDTDTEKRKYVTVSHLAIEAYSTQSADGKRPYYAPNAIDGNGNTLWHTDFRVNVLGQEQKPFITIKLDEPKYISALEFKQIKYKANDPDNIKNAIVYVSEDGENWVEAGRIENCPQDTELRDITFETSVYGQYVKIEMETYNMFASLAMVNIFEDLSKVEKVSPTASIAYSTTIKTNEPVIARLVNPSTKITITSEGGDSHVFTENGEFTFEFKDEKGNKGTAKAKVDWIDKNGPTADVKYKIDDDKKLIAILDDISEDVYLLDKNNKKTNYIKVEDGKVVSVSFLDENGEEYKVSELDENRVTKKITYKNTTKNVQNAKYYVITLDNKGNITSRTGLDEDGKTIALSESEIGQLSSLEGMRSNPLEFYLEKNEEYEFKLQDAASNVTNKNVKVDYIENDTKILVSAITYSTTNTTKNPVDATIKAKVIDMNGVSKDAKILSDGGTTHKFNDNGSFKFKYADSTKSDNDATREEKEHIAKVTWIDTKAPTAKIKYTTSSNKDKVVATLTDESESITITNNGGKRDYTFTENKEFTFEFVDKAGNKGTAKATVDWIGKEEPKDTFKVNKYTIKNKDISNISSNTTVSEFKKNIETNQTMIFKNKNGKVLSDNDLVGTNTIIDVQGKVSYSTYTLIVKGDVDGDGDITEEDLAQLQLDYLETQLLQGRPKLAADMDGDGENTPEDIAQIQLILLEK